MRTKTVKRSARIIVERYYSKCVPLRAARALHRPPLLTPIFRRLTLDFDTNKRVTDEIALVPSKRMRNKIAGFTTHLMRRIERGDNVRGISLKLQEEERERRMDFVPAESAINANELIVDPDTKALLDHLGLGAVPVTVQDAKRQEERRDNQRGPPRDRR